MMPPIKKTLEHHPVLLRTFVHGVIGLSALYIIVSHYSGQEIEHLAVALGFSLEEVSGIILALLGMGGLERVLRKRKAD